ncbi:MAG: hypothetical protein E6G94_14535 [Alphaproteobacteria bacterium]|nr:MAG: hypothetical protein E6G94_14535 [Alphaproteobacteria bacterium]
MRLPLRRGLPPVARARAVAASGRAGLLPGLCPKQRPAIAHRRLTDAAAGRGAWRRVIARSEATRQSSGLRGCTGLLRFARNDGALLVTTG